MKSQFAEHFPISESRKKELWDNCIFVFDANILLGMYRYSNNTQESFFSILDAIKDRCWLPHQAAKEYFSNRFGVIKDQAKAYKKITESINDIESDFKSQRHPFLASGTLDGTYQSV